MENIITERVKKTELTKSQRKIAEYFIANSDQLATMSSMDVAKKIGVSDASIIRFARAIGFDGFADLKQQVYQQLVENANGGQSLLERLSQNVEKHGQKGSPEQFVSLMESNLVSVFRDNSTEDFQTVADRLIGARKRFILGFRGTKGIASHVARTMYFMMPGVVSILDGSHENILRFHDVTDQDVVLMFVFSRFYKKDLHYIRTAHENGAWVCLVTNAVAGPLTQYADKIIRVETENMSFFHSTIAADMAGEYILNLVGNQVDYHERMDSLDEVSVNDRL